MARLIRLKEKPEPNRDGNEPTATRNEKDWEKETGKQSK